MQVLIATGGLLHFTGTESWTYEMAKELSKEHDVSVYAVHNGKATEKIKEICEVVDKMEDIYDFIIVNHNTTLDEIPFKEKVIFTCHGLNEIEQPNCNVKTVGVKERLGYPVIRNGIDCERFKPTKSRRLENILYLSNPNYSEGIEFIREACEDHNLITIEKEVFNIEEYINKADLVITMARGALESMACGKNVIYGDYRDGWDGFMSGGLITTENYEDFKTGKMFEDLKQLSVDDLKKEIKKYDNKYGRVFRKRIVDEFNIVKTAKQYVELGNSLNLL